VYNDYLKCVGKKDDKLIAILDLSVILTDSEIDKLEENFEDENNTNDDNENDDCNDNEGSSENNNEDKLEENTEENEKVVKKG